MDPNQDFLAGAKELLDNYWNREPITNAYGEIDPEIDAQARTAELLTIVVYALIALIDADRERA